MQSTENHNNRPTGSFPPHTHYQLALLALKDSTDLFEKIVRFSSEGSLSEQINGMVLLKQMIGTRSQYHFLPSWNHCYGPLCKLLYYLTLELERSEEKHLHQLLYQQRLEVEEWVEEVKRSIDLLGSCKGDVLTLPVAIIENMSSLVRHLQLASLHWARYFRGNENVLYFALCRAEELQYSFGKGFLRALLSTLFDKQSCSIRDYLKERYAKRQFDKLLPAIDGHVKALERWIC